MGLVADSNVTFPPEVAANFATAITALRSALIGLEAWAKDQPPPVRVVATRAFQWWTRCITLTEPLIITAEKP